MKIHWTCAIIFLLIGIGLATFVPVVSTPFTMLKAKL